MVADYASAMQKINDMLKVETRSEAYEVQTGRSGAGVKGMAGIRRRINKLPVWMSKAAKAAALEVGLEGFRAAMLRVPVATGKLARSGKLWLNNKVMARGFYSHGNTTGVNANPGLYDNDPFLVNEEDMVNVLKGTINVYIEFNRLDEKGQNLAYWLHENLNEYGSGVSPQASKSGRGPKFVEGPMNTIIIPKLYDRVFKNINFLVKNIQVSK